MIGRADYRLPNAEEMRTYSLRSDTGRERRKWPVSGRGYRPCMSKTPYSDPIQVADSWAEVRARDQVMRYRRSGVGRAALLVLRPPDSPQPLWPELLDSLGERFRLIAPEPPALEADAACWLADFIEGLGSANISILAAGCFCIPVLELALDESDQISRIVLVPNGVGREVGGPCRGMLDTETRHLPVPLLVVRRGQPAAEILPLVTGFLSGR